MAQTIILNGRSAVVLYCDDTLAETLPERATLAKVFFDDGAASIYDATIFRQSITNSGHLRHLYALGWCVTCGVPRYDCKGDWSEDLHPRDEHGRFANGADTSGGHYERPLVFHVDTVKQALELILEGKTVEVDSVRKVNTLLKKLAKIAADAKKRGVDAPDYDLCHVTVPGTNLFCAARVRTAKYPNGIERIKMPQFGGMPRPGSPADALPKNAKGGVDASDAFKDHLKSLGIAISGGSERVASLRASQAELVGPHVAEIMERKNFDPRKSTIWVSRDNYVIDGHHRWAAAVGLDAEDGHLGDTKIKIIRVDAPISEVLKISMAFTDKFGILPAAGTSKSKTKGRR